MQLHGEFRGYSTQTVEIADKKQIYTIKKDFLTAAQKKELQNKRIKAPVDLTIPFGAIEKVRPLSGR